MVEFHVVSCFAQATGPSIMATKEIFNGKMECEGPSCDATWEASLGGLSALHQVLFVSARLEKPHYKTHPEAEKSPFEALQADFPLTFHITAVGIDDSGKEHTLLSNATHTRTVNCPAHAMQCDPFVVFAQAHVAYPQYSLEVTFKHPISTFTTPETERTVRMTMYESVIKEAYTKFEAGWKYFFVSIAVLFSIAYCLVAISAQRRQKLTFEQRWAAALLVGLIFFNDPFFLAAVYTPGVAWPGINSLLVVTFLAALLFYFLCELHIIVKAAEQRTTNTSRVERPATFFLFKAILITVFWAFGIAASMYTLYRLDNDPAFSYWEDSEQDSNSFATKFMAFAWGVAYFVGAVYLVWFAFLFLMACRHYQRLANHMWFTLLLITAAVICVVATYFAGAAFGRPDASVTFLAFYAAVNLFVWFNAFAQLPQDKRWGFDQSMGSEPRELGHDGAMEEGGFDEEAGVMGHGVRETDLGGLDSDDDRAHRSRRSGGSRGGGGGGGGGAGAFVIGEGDSDEEEETRAAAVAPANGGRVGDPAI